MTEKCEHKNMKTREYIDKYDGLLFFFWLIVPIVFIAKIYIEIAGYLLDKVMLKD